MGNPSFSLSDWDTARFNDEKSNSHSSEYTLRYASTEFITTGIPTYASDYWALGMVLLEKYTGAHPFENIDNQAIKEIMPNWQPALELIEDERWRALLSGLLVKDPRKRWGHQEIVRWLNIDDHSIITDGLSLYHEQASRIPFICEDFLAYSIKGLINNLIKLPLDRAYEILSSEPLRNWVSELNRIDISNILNSALNHESNAQSVLMFCYDINRNLVPYWNGYAFNKQEIAEVASRATQGNQDCFNWIISLRESFLFKFFGSRGHEEINDLGRNISENSLALEECWQRIIEAGAPEDSRPDDDHAFVAIVNLCSNEDYRQQVINELYAQYDPTILLCRSDWFLEFGSNIQELRTVEIYILHSLIDASRLREITVFDSSQDPSEAIENVDMQEEVPISSIQAHLMRNKSIPKSPEIINLEAGEHHNIETHRERIMQWLQWLWITIHRFLYRERSDPENPLPEMTVKIVSLVSSRSNLIEFDDENEYLALVRWGVQENPEDNETQNRIKIFLSEPGILFNHHRYISPQMPENGQMLFTIAKSTQFRLERSRGFFRSPEKSAPICIYIKKKEFKNFQFQKFKKTSGKFIKLQSSFKLKFIDKFLKTSDRFISIKKSILNTNHEFVSTTGYSYILSEIKNPFGLNKRKLNKIQLFLNLRKDGLSFLRRKNE